MECLKCGQTKESIKRNHLFCATVDPQTGEAVEEWDRHRFKPWSKKELKGQAEQERLIVEDMQAYVDFMNEIN